MTRSPVIEASHLGRSFGDVVAVDDLSFTVPAGGILGLLGPNGAGKTTLVKMLTTLIGIDTGSASIAGFDVTGRPDSVREVIGLAGQSAAVDEKLTARENLELFARLYGIDRATRRGRIADLIDRFDLEPFADRPASTYSGGERRRLDVVAALVAEPLALFLDEPTTGLDPRSRNELWDAIRGLAADGTAIVLTSQYLEEADRLSDRILVIDRGRCVAEGSPEQLKQSVGRDVLQITLATSSDAAAARRALGAREDLLDGSTAHRLDVQIADGPAHSLDLLRRIEDSGATITDFQLRRPTLDDAFLALTGSRTTESGGRTT